ncbi:MAG TPA: hypothetical protein VFI47_04030 [Acidimicrobiales bacterium]|nr:hypothetical protein [Acidimicrobiales bacterium]
MPIPLRALLDRLFDDAGLFPPSRLPMADALHAHSRAAAGPHGRVVGSFVCPSTRLGELDACVAGGLPRPASIAVLGYGGPAAWRGVSAARGVVQVEAAPGVDLPPPSRRVARYVEVPQHVPLDAALDAAQASGLRIKLMCGGITRDMVPSCDWLAAALVGAVARGLVVKASGGLVQPFRQLGPDHAHHGFVNLLAAAGAARARHPAGTVSEVLAADEGQYSDLATYLSGSARNLLASIAVSSIAAPLDALADRGLL